MDYLQNTSEFMDAGDLNRGSPLPPEVRFLVFRCFCRETMDYLQSTSEFRVMDVDDLNQTLAERRSRREHRLPKRYRDVLPERPAALPPTSQPSSESIPPASASPSAEAMPPAASASRGSSVLSRVRRLLKSTRNAFGLFRQYHATQFPEHDPDEDITLDDLMDKSSNLLESYHPYPTRSSF
jgi:hypothetical protein